MNPATFLRVLGPEPWKVVYVEPSIRPDDSRYGENPNRLQRHSQLQVEATSEELLGEGAQKHVHKFIPQPAHRQRSGRA